MPMTSSPALNTRPMPSGLKQNCGIGLAQFALTLHPDKTRLIQLGRVRRVICRCRQGFEEFGCACPDTVGGQSPFSQHSDQIVSTLGLGGLHH
jgi:hypothetical protein